MGKVDRVSQVDWDTLDHIFMSKAYEIHFFGFKNKLYLGTCY